jgi:hypothetical protein
MNSLKKLIDREKGNLIKKQHDFEKNFKINCSVRYHITDKGIIYGYNKEKLYFIGKYEMLGTFNDNTCYWLWSWANPSISNKLLNYGKNLIKFGESKKISDFINPRIKGKTKAFKFLVLGAYVNSDCLGYIIYKKPRTQLFAYLLIKTANQPNITYNRFKKTILEI